MNSNQLNYIEHGEGPLAVFVHGFPLDHRMWLGQLDALSRSRRCVAVDLRGSGGSPAWHGGALTMEQHAVDIVDLIDHLGESQADIIGLSMGGYVALAMWERHHEVVRSLVLADTKAAGDDDAGKAGRDAAAARLVREGRSSWGGGLIDVLVADSASTEVRARMRDMVEDTAYETIVAALMGMKERKDRSGLLASITVPTLVAVGEHDALTPPEVARSMATAIPGAHLSVIPNAGHMAPLEQPNPFNLGVAEFWEPGTAR